MPTLWFFLPGAAESAWSVKEIDYTTPGGDDQGYLECTLHEEHGREIPLPSGPMLVSYRDGCISLFYLRRVHLRVYPLPNTWQKNNSMGLLVLDQAFWQGATENQQCLTPLLRDAFVTWSQKGLLDVMAERTLFIQNLSAACCHEMAKLACETPFRVVGHRRNVGIGPAQRYMMTHAGKAPYVLFLERDFVVSSALSRTSLRKHFRACK